MRLMKFLIILLFQCKQPEFHLYHTHIELRWFFITLVHSRTVWYQCQMHSMEEFENSAEMIINDLTYFALKVFDRVIKLISRIQSVLMKILFYNICLFSSVFSYL